MKSPTSLYFLFVLNNTESPFFFYFDFTRELKDLDRKVYVITNLPIASKYVDSLKTIQNIYQNNDDKF